GVPVPFSEPGDTTLEHSRSHLRRLGWRITDSAIRQWVAHALLHLEPELRAVLYWRESRGETYQQVGTRLGITPFAAARLVIAAHEELRAKLPSYYEQLAPLGSQVADAGADRGEPSAKRGRLLTLPRGATGKKDASGSPDDSQAEKTDDAAPSAKRRRDRD